MRQVPSDKYTIAWFKLADCISKGEREKAFGVYRLLAHSLEDEAYAIKLEGDLLFAFHDTAAAIEKYEQAAVIYQQHKRFKEAAALYEDLLSVTPDQEKYISQLIELYKNHVSPSFLASKYIRLYELVSASHKPEKAHSILVELELHVDEKELSKIYTSYVFSLLKNNYSDKTSIQEYIVKVLNTLKHEYDHTDLNTFLAGLELYDQELYQDAILYLKG